MMKELSKIKDELMTLIAENIRCTEIEKLERDEVIAEFEDNVTISIPKELWDEFCGREQA